MKIAGKGSILFGGMLLVYALVIVITSLGYPADDGLIPIIIGVATIAIGILVIINEVKPTLLSSFDVGLVEFAEGGRNEENGYQESRGTETGKRLTIISLWLIGFFVLIFLVGFIISVGLFMLVFLKIYGKFGWIITVAETVVMLGFTYAIFELLLKAELFPGILFGVLLPPA